MDMVLHSNCALVYNVEYDSLNLHPYIIPHHLNHPKISTLDDTKLLQDSVQVVYTTVYGVWGNVGQTKNICETISSLLSPEPS